MELNRITIKKIIPEEKDELASIFKSYIIEIDPASAIKQSHAEDFIASVLRNLNRQLFWCLIEGKKCGFSILTIEKLWPLTDSNKGRISEFYIFPEYRKKTIGQQFANKLISILKEHNCSLIELEVHYNNARGLAFWQYIGFEIKKYLMKYTF